MKLTKNKWLRGAGRQIRQTPVVVVLMAIGLLGMALVQVASGEAMSTTTVQGTVYLANGHAGSGTLRVSWPTFATANGQAVIADSTIVTIGTDGFVSVNLAPNLGATPAGLYYTAVFYLSDGTTSTQYWVVPSAAQASLAQVQSQVMPAAQAVQAVNKAYVDQSIAALSQSQLTASGGTLSGPLYLSADPTQAMQAADKHYVDTAVSQSVPIAGGAATGPLTAVQLGAAYQVDQFPGTDFGAKLEACLSAVSATYGGTCDARNFSGTLAMGTNLMISTGNTTVELPCATIATANQVVVTAGTRNVALRGCALRGGTTASGSQGGTVFAYSGTGAMVQVGDPTYSADTQGFHMDDVVINTTAATSAAAQGLVAYRTQEMDLESLYFLGNANQTGMTLDGTKNYTGGTFYDNAFNGFQTAVNAIGHQVSNAATTDWVNASTFLRLHIDCPTSAGNPIAGTYGINLQQGDGNTFTGGDVEGCSTAMHLGANAQNNTIVGLRNENSSSQVVADAGSQYNNWMTGGTMFTGRLTDNGTRNSFLDTFHRSFNGMKGDWYGSQQDATVTNHYRIGTGTGNERGLLNRYQTDYGYRWTTGLSDATAGEQFYQVLDELNNVYRLSIGQYNNGQPSTNNQTVINAAGTGAVVLNGSNNAGTGGVVIGSGGANASAVATINNAGNAQFNGALQVGGTSTFTGSTTVRNQTDAEIDQLLWAGATTSQKESLTYKDWNGNSQWYAEKDSSNNWALNSATGGLDSFKAYQSTNSGDTYVNASNASGVVRVNYETGAGTAFKIYGGSGSSLYASFTGANSIQFPGLAAGSGHNCLQIDNSGYISNTGSACGTGSGSGTVSSANSGQIAYYTGNGTSIGGMDTVPLAAGGTGSVTAAGALQNLGGISLALTASQTMAGPLNMSTAYNSSTNNLNQAATAQNVRNVASISVKEFGAVGDGTTDDTTAINAALTYELTNGGCIYFPQGAYMTTSALTWNTNKELCLVGEKSTTSYIDYMGTGTIDATLVVKNTTVSGNGYFSAVNLRNIGFAANAHASYALHGTQIGPPGQMDNVDFMGGSISAFEGDFWNGQADLRNLRVAAVAFYPVTGATCVNGLTFNQGLYYGTSSYYPSGQFSMQTPTVEGCTGVGLNIANGSAITVNNAQLAGNHQQLYVNCTTGCNAPGSLFSNILVEDCFGGTGCPGGTNSISSAVYGNGNVFIGMNSGANPFLIYGNQNQFLGQNQMNVAVQSGATGTVFENNYLTSTSTDGGTGTIGFGNKNEVALPNNTFNKLSVSTLNGITGCNAGTGSLFFGNGDAPCASTAAYSSALGIEALGQIGSANPGSTVAIGAFALTYDGANGNTAVGYGAGQKISGGSTNNTGASYSDFFGANAFPQGATDVNEMVLGQGTTGHGSYTVTLGNSSVTATYLMGDLYTGANKILPSAVTGYHGTSGTQVQLSDGTGTSGNLAKFASDGSVTNGPMPPTGTIVGTSDTQTLTNKSIAGSEINSGTIGPAYGGTGQNESSATGIGQWSSGTYSVSAALANNTAATTQSANDNSTKVATTAYVASPGAIAPTTVTASGIIAGGNDTARTTSTTIGSTSFTATGLVLPTVPVSTTKIGRCVVYWQMSSTSNTATFGIGMSNTPTGLWGGSSVTYAAAGTSNWLAFAQTATAAAAISTAATAGVTNTTYRAEIDFTLQTGATNPVAITLYGEVSNASATLTIQPGSACYWLP
jgi:hypothetical protein